MNDYRSEIENLPGSGNSRIPKQEHMATKGVNNYNRNTLTSPEMNQNLNDVPRKKYFSENEKTCVKYKKKIKKNIFKKQKKGQRNRY